jgi:hypothetical protein
MTTEIALYADCLQQYQYYLLNAEKPSIEE